jgi:PAS domain S-box-containing protein
MQNADSEDELFASIEHTPIATIVTNPRLPDNPIVAVNEPFLKLTGYSREEVLGRNCRFLAGPETEQQGSAALARATAEARPELTELLNYRRDGTAFRNAVMIAPVFGASGELLYFLGSQMDVTGGGTAPPVDRRRQAGAQVDGLTGRQREVLQQMTLGYRNKQIAIRLGISEKTVKMHRAALLSKLGAATSADAVRIAVEAGL